MRRAARIGAAALAACSAAQAQDTASAYEASVALVHRKLTERGPSGATLLTERGWMPQARGSVAKVLPAGGAVAASLALAGADIDYNGQTQAGVPLSTTTRQTEFAADLLWRPFAPLPWGEAWLTLQWLGNHRAIASTATAGGLDETSQATLLGARWTSPSFAAVAGWQAHVEADGRISVQHRLRVDYRGLLDPSTLEGARKRQWALRLVGARPASPWGWEVEAAHLSQRASDSVPVYRAGSLFGTVRQPALTIDDLTLRVSRRF